MTVLELESEVLMRMIGVRSYTQVVLSSAPARLHSGHPLEVCAQQILIVNSHTRAGGGGGGGRIVTPLGSKNRDWD